MASRQALESQGMPQLYHMPVVADDYVNSGISINYVVGWDLKEALRELIQNAIDAMVSFMKKRAKDNNFAWSKAKATDWKVNMHEHNHTLGKFRTFTVTAPSRGNLVIGKITFDPDTKEVVLENPGTINKFNLLLGGSGSNKREDDPDIIGRFGEGMKLAALALLRPGQKPFAEHLLTHTRGLTIDTGGHRWLFKLQQDANFDNEICLFYRIRNFTKREKQKVTDNWTYTRISGVTIAEWNANYKNFTFFCKPEEIMEIPTLSPNATHKGSLLLDDSMKGRFFVKDLHIHDYGSYDYEEKDDQKTYNNFSKADPAASYYGYNTNEVELNRDRKSIPNLWHKYDRSSCIAADVLNNMQRNLNLHPDARDLLNEMWIIIYLSLRMDKLEIHYFVQYVKNNKATCDRIWREWVKDKRYFAANENNNNQIQPMYVSHEVSVQRFFAQNNLEKTFYRYKVLSNRLCGVLQHSTYYEHWNTRFQNLINGCNDSVLNDNERAVKGRLVQKMQRIQNNFNEDMVRFKDAPLQKATSYFKDGKLFLAKELIANENELLLKCLQLMKIPSSRLLEFCNL